jgi:hypothetical protein
MFHTSSSIIMFIKYHIMKLLIIDIIIVFLDSFTYIFKLDVKAWSVPLQVVVGLRQGQFF